MTLTAADVAEIMRLVEQSKFDELSLEMDGIKLTLRRAGAAGGFVESVTTQSSVSDRAATAGSRSDLKLSQAQARDGGAEEADASLRDITSPMLGTFYRAPKPGSRATLRTLRIKPSR